MYQTLRDFVHALDEAGELHRITAPVSPVLEITEIADRISKSSAAKVSEHAKAFDPHHAHLGGKALLFENVVSPDGIKAVMPVLINAFGSYRRMEMALGCTQGGFESLAEKVTRLVRPQPPSSFLEKLKAIPELSKIASYPPKIVRSGICQEVVRTGEQVDLFNLPLIKCWPDDGDPRKAGFPIDPPPGGGDGRYITMGGMYTIHPDDIDKPVGEPRPSRNVGMYRAQLLTKNTTAMHWHIHHDGASHWRAWKERFGGERPMPLAIVLGVQSVLPYAATAPLPPGISELLFAGFLNDGPISLVPCKTIDLQVPANAEIVIEGTVSTVCGAPGYDPRERRSETKSDGARWP